MLATWRSVPPLAWCSAAWRSVPEAPSATRPGTRPGTRRGVAYQGTKPVAPGMLATRGQDASAPLLMPQDASAPLLLRMQWQWHPVLSKRCSMPLQAASARHLHREQMAWGHAARHLQMASMPGATGLVPWLAICISCICVYRDTKAYRRSTAGGSCVGFSAAGGTCCARGGTLWLPGELAGVVAGVGIQA